MSDKKHIAIVSTWFHPAPQIAAFRINAFAKYLDHDKFEVTVFTLGNVNEDEELFGSTVHRVAAKNLIKRREQRTSDTALVHHFKSINNILVDQLFKNENPGWDQLVLEKMLEVDGEKRIDMVISSYGPIDAHEAAFKFLSEKPGAKWILDMRDEMSARPTKSKVVRKWLLSKEEEYAGSADAVVSVSLPILNDFRSSMGEDGILYKLVRNGYDHDEEPQHGYNDEFTLLYAGTFYGAIKPDQFFTALLELKKTGELPVDWRLDLLGTHENFKVPEQLRSNLNFLLRVDNLSAIRQMNKSDCLLMIHPISERRGVYTGKLFDYLSVQKPILAIVDPTDVAADLIREMNAGFIAGHDDIRSIQAAFMQAYSVWKSRKSLPFDPHSIGKLHRRCEVEKLGKLIDEMFQSVDDRA